MSIAEPVLARLEQLHDQWATFSQLPRARLLLWRVADGEAAMVESFIARESDDETAETSDLFLRLTIAFRDANTHGLTLAKELVDQYDQVFDSAGEDGPRWKCPARREREGDIAFLLRVLTAFRQHLVGESATKVAVWLDPDAEVADEAYLRWLQRLTQEAPAELRFLALESSSDMEYESLGKAEPERVVVCPCALDMPGALVEIAERANTRGPGAEFRRLQTLVAQALELGQLDRAVELGGLATTSTTRMTPKAT